MSATQKGTTLKISFGSMSYTASYVPEDATATHPDGNVEVIKNADGATLTKIMMDPSTKIDATFVILAAGSIDPPVDGSVVVLTTPAGAATSFLTIGSSAKFAAGATRLSLSLIKEDAITLTT